MKEIFKEPCNTYYKIFNNKQDSGYKYRSLSPFEFKNTLLKLAGKENVLNAGRGNPNFFSTIPRYAFAMLQIYSTYLGSEISNSHGIGYIPPVKGMGDKLNTLITKDSKSKANDFLIKAITLSILSELTAFINPSNICSLFLAFSSNVIVLL